MSMSFALRSSSSASQPPDRQLLEAVEKGNRKRVEKLLHNENKNPQSIFRSNEAAALSLLVLAAGDPTTGIFQLLLGIGGNMMPKNPGYPWPSAFREALIRRDHNILGQIMSALSDDASLENMVSILDQATAQFKESFATPRLFNQGIQVSLQAKDSIQGKSVALEFALLPTNAQRSKWNFFPQTAIALIRHGANTSTHAVSYASTLRQLLFFNPQATWTDSGSDNAHYGVFLANWWQAEWEFATSVGNDKSEIYESWWRALDDAVVNHMSSFSHRGGRKNGYKGLATRLEIASKFLCEKSWELQIGGIRKADSNRAILSRHLLSTKGNPDLDKFKVAKDDAVVTYYYQRGEEWKGGKGKSRFIARPEWYQPELATDFPDSWRNWW